LRLGTDSAGRVREVPQTQSIIGYGVMDTGNIGDFGQVMVNDGGGGGAGGAQGGMVG
jgi:hypothetical protein